jgi:hypothetical protein
LYFGRFDVVQHCLQLFRIGHPYPNLFCWIRSFLPQNLTLLSDLKSRSIAYENRQMLPFLSIVTEAAVNSPLELFFCGELCSPHYDLRLPLRTRDSGKMMRSTHTQAVHTVQRNDVNGMRPKYGQPVEQNKLSPTDCCNLLFCRVASHATADFVCYGDRIEDINYNTTIISIASNSSCIHQRRTMNSPRADLITKRIRFLSAVTIGGRGGH